MDTSHLRQSIAIAVAEARRDAGLTQPQLADFAQRSRSYIAAIEAGSVNVTCETLYALLAVFGRDPVDFFRRVEELRRQRPEVSRPGRGKRRAVILDSGGDS